MLLSRQTPLSHTHASDFPMCRIYIFFHWTSSCWHWSNNQCCQDWFSRSWYSPVVHQSSSLMNIHSNPSSRSFLKILNGTGPKTKPFSIPPNLSLQADMKQFISTTLSPGSKSAHFTTHKCQTTPIHQTWPVLGKNQFTLTHYGIHSEAHKGCR